jgi:hypothetical protein
MRNPARAEAAVALLLEEETMDHDPLSIDLLMAALGQDRHDVAQYLEILAGRLKTALPELVAVERAGRWPRRGGPVERLSIRLGEWLYVLAHGPGGLQATRERWVRGVRIRAEALAAERWLEELAQRLREVAMREAAVREGLERLLLG